MHLDENKLSELPEGIFKDLSSLELLELGRNKFSTLQENIFEDLSTLEQLYLYDNDIEYLPPDIFKSLSSLESLYIYSNPLECMPYLENVSYGYYASSSSITSLDVEDLPLCEDIDETEDGLSGTSSRSFSSSTGDSGGSDQNGGVGGITSGAIVGYNVLGGWILFVGIITALVI